MARALIVCDVFGWAQSHHAAGLKEYAPDWCEVETTDLSGYGKMPDERVAAFDVVHILYLGSATRRKCVRRLTSMLASHAWMHPELKPNNWRTRGVTQGRCLAVAKGMLAGLDAVVARNGELEKFGRKFNPNTRFIPVGVDLKVFMPAGWQRHDKLRVGWCGQTGGLTSFKGHREILVPLMKRLGNEFYDWRINTRAAADARTIDEMVAWYQSLDVFLCTSCAEGTPNPPIEAAACGVPVISTNVGTIRHWKPLGVLGLRVPDYGRQEEADMVVGAFGVRLEWLRRDRTFRRYCGKRLREHVEAVHDYKIVAPKLLEFICG